MHWRRLALMSRCLVAIVAYIRSLCEFLGEPYHISERNKRNFMSLELVQLQLRMLNMTCCWKMTIWIFQGTSVLFYKFITFWCGGIFSGFHVPKFIHIHSFLTELFRKNRMAFWTTVYIYNSVDVWHYSFQLYYFACLLVGNWRSLHFRMYFYGYNQQH